MKHMNLKKFAAPASLVAGLASTSAFANEEIEAAITAGQSNVTLVVGGIIGILAITFGLSFIRSLMSR
ncbi:hypothetical protein [Enterovibrio paralichthyis]|uniref:hypothetical protein n=1 Tax=Enterovibrio paralichthyis TaxID=2853805 RepID=UPI001C4857D0|nr:hypothetical protein [Enterovibrio paralichthyis]MBV7296614.1 hypothetical protein [Enterovibrio paralichthyis]